MPVSSRVVRLGAVVALAATLAAVTLALADRRPAPSRGAVPVESPASAASLPATVSSTTSSVVPALPVKPDGGGLVAASTSSQPTDIPDHRGPGAVLEFEAEKAPIVPEGESVSDYVTAYYRALVAGEWEQVTRMVPSQSGKPSVGEFRRLNDGYVVKTFRLFQPARSDGRTSLIVATVSPEDGVWNVTWEFIQTPRGLALNDLTYARPGGAGCH